MSVVTSRSFYVGSVVITLFVAVIVNIFAESSCSLVSKSIGEKEKQLARLEKDRDRESARWEEMKTDENLDRMLPKHGLLMRYPKPEQIVRMRPDGVPYAGQLSLAVARRENRPVQVRNARGSRRAPR